MYTCNNFVKHFLKNLCQKMEEKGKLDWIIQEYSFVYDSKQEFNGILHWIGTQHDTKRYNNPALLGSVAIKSSDICESSNGIHSIVGKEAVRCILDEIPNAWFSIDFGNSYVKISPTHYTLRHYSSWDTEFSFIRIQYILSYMVLNYSSPI